MSTTLPTESSPPSPSPAPAEPASPTSKVSSTEAPAPTDSLTSADPSSSTPAPSVSDSAPSDPDPNATIAPSAWQAVWSPQYNAYYFYNTLTQETTWTNPLQPTPAAEPASAAEPDSAAPAAAAPTDAVLAAHAALQAAAIAQGIDPALAHLDPSLLAGPSAAGPSALPAFTAKFNARTGAFARPDARDPTHLSEFERAKRMSEFYFDVNAWEADVAQRHAAEAEGSDGRKRKRPTKKDLERFKQQKKLKKIAKTAWLRT